MKEQRKKCAVEGCGKPAVGKVPATKEANLKLSDEQAKAVIEFLKKYVA